MKREQLKSAKLVSEYFMHTNRQTLKVVASCFFGLRLDTLKLGILLSISFINQLLKINQKDNVPLVISTIVKFLYYQHHDGVLLVFAIMSHIPPKLKHA